MRCTSETPAEIPRQPIVLHNFFQLNLNIRKLPCVSLTSSLDTRKTRAAPFQPFLARSLAIFDRKQGAECMNTSSRDAITTQWDHGQGAKHWYLPLQIPQIQLNGLTKLCLSSSEAHEPMDSLMALFHCTDEHVEISAGILSLLFSRLLLWTDGKSISCLRLYIGPTLSSLSLGCPTVFRTRFPNPKFKYLAKGNR